MTLPTVAAEALAEHLIRYARLAGWARGLRFHGLRHTAATLAMAAGASTREL